MPASLFDKRRDALAARVRALRIERGYSQEALAHEVGIDRTYQSQIERGVGNPSLRVLCSIAEALDIELSDLLSA